MDETERHAESPSAAALLAIRGVTVSYAPDQRPCLAGVHLDVREGELVCLLGPNGAGKSSLLRVASGVLPASSGEVSIFGATIAGRSRRDIARWVAVVEQTQDLGVGFTVREVVALGRAPHQGSWMLASARDDAVVEDALARCDLARLAARPAHALSGGEQKRVAIARALAQEPRLLMLDEPAAFLDIRHQLDLYDLLVREVKGRRLGCLVVMHDLNAAAEFADRVVFMKDGRIMSDGTVEDVMTRARIREVFETDLRVVADPASNARYFLPARRGDECDRSELRGPASRGARDPTRS